MKKGLPILILLTAFLAINIFPISSFAQDNQTPKLVLDGSTQSYDDESLSGEDDEPVERVARVSFVDGDVSFLRAGVTEWSDAVENLPLLSGDQIYVGKRGRAEIQFGRGNYVRLSEQTALTITELSHTAALLEITEGIAIIRLERFGAAWNRFEVDTPNSALILQRDGIYRINVRGERDSEVIVRRGSAEVSTDDGDFRVRENQRLTIDTTPNGRLEIVADNSNDDWDRWSYDRDTTIATNYINTSPDYVSSYETNYNCFYGASDLAAYGFWTNVSSYGNCWVPRVASGWAPYRTGRWLWIPRTGWTWLSSEPWGWAPYHYGRWAYINNLGWAWVPGFHNRYYNYGHSYYQWRPALVSFYNTGGSHVGWCPLAPGERWRNPNRFRNDNPHRHLQYPTTRDAWRRPDSGSRPRNQNGITWVAANEFGGRPNGRLKSIDNTHITRVEGAVKPGLPDLRAAENSGVVVWRNGDSNSRRPVAPPKEIIGRSVVTRQRPTDTEVTYAPPRERKFIGTPTMTDSGSLKNRRVYRGDTGSEISTGEGTSRSKDKSQNNGEANGNSDNRNRNTDAANNDSSRARRKFERADEGSIVTREEKSQSDSNANWKSQRSTPTEYPNSDNAAERKKRERNNDDQSPNNSDWRSRRTDNETQNGGESNQGNANRERKRQERQEQPQNDNGNRYERRREEPQKPVEQPRPREERQQEKQERREMRQREEPRSAPPPPPPQPSPSKEERRARKNGGN
ncbi:MAG: DUF6600 domain-containing protein [Acidobacteriota bacterium]